MSTITRTEQVARGLLATNGERDPHPSLLADTMNEVAYAGLDTKQPPLPTFPVYTVAKNEYEVPCDHPMCETLHRDLPWGHEWKRTEWVLLEDGQRKGWVGQVDAFERKRDALAVLKREGLA